MLSNIIADLLLSMTPHGRDEFQRAVEKTTQHYMRVLFMDELDERHLRDVTKRAHECVDLARMCAEFRPHTNQTYSDSNRAVFKKPIKNTHTNQTYVDKNGQHDG